MLEASDPHKEVMPIYQSLRAWVRAQRSNLLSVNLGLRNEAELQSCAGDCFGKNLRKDGSQYLRNALPEVVSSTREKPDFYYS